MVDCAVVLLSWPWVRVGFDSEECYPLVLYLFPQICSRGCGTLFFNLIIIFIYSSANIVQFLSKITVHWKEQVLKAFRTPLRARKPREVAADREAREGLQIAVGGLVTHRYHQNAGVIILPRQPQKAAEVYRACDLRRSCPGGRSCTQLDFSCRRRHWKTICREYR